MTKRTKILIFSFCILKLIFHLIADSHSGFQADELLHIESGNHLAFGYMEFPPLIGFLAFLQNLFASNSVYIHHLFSHISSVLILIYVAKITIELGGKNRAVFLALFCILIAPSFERSQQLFQPVVFSQLFWVLGFYQLTRFVKYHDKKSLWFLTIFIVLGFSVKYDALFFMFGLIALLFFEQTRKALIRNHFWNNIIVAFLLFIPNLIWQYQNNFPALQMFNRLYETQLDKISRLDNLGALLLGINPLVSLLMVTPAIIYFYINKKSFISILSISIFISIGFLFFKNGKAYYFYPIVLTIIPFGALYWEQNVFQKKQWLLYPITILLLFGFVLIPFGMPIYSLNRYLTKVYPFEKKEIEGGKYSVKYEEYYSKEKWSTTMQQLKSVYDSLPKSEKQKCIIWGKHYGQAGAINLFGIDYNLPNAFSYHGSFYSWTPKGKMPPTIIALSYQVGDFFNPYFEEVKLVRTIYNPYSDNEEELYQKIYICRKPKKDFDEMKELFKYRIFE